jgi:hypothetical protein
LERVKEAASAGEIWNSAGPDRQLWFWWGTGADTEVKSFTSNAMTSEIGLRKLLDISVSRVKSTAGDYDHVQKSWEKVVDLDALKLRAEKLINSAGSDADIKLARRFLDALQRGREDRF